MNKKKNIKRDIKIIMKKIFVFMIMIMMIAPVLSVTVFADDNQHQDANSGKYDSSTIYSSDNPFIDISMTVCNDAWGLTYNGEVMGEGKATYTVYYTYTNSDGSTGSVDLDSGDVGKTATGDQNKSFGSGTDTSGNERDGNEKTITKSNVDIQDHESVVIHARSNSEAYDYFANHKNGVNGTVDNYSHYQTGFKDVLVKQSAVSTYTLQYSAANGGTGTIPKSRKVIVNASIALASNSLYRKGYHENGWSTGDDNTPEYSSGQTVSKLGSKNDTVTLYSCFSPNTYTVAYSKGIGEERGLTTGSVDSQGITYDGGNFNLRGNGYIRTGYNFKGWDRDINKSSSSPTYTASQSVNVNDFVSAAGVTDSNGATVTLYAIWEPKKYNIYYNSSNGSGTMDTQVATYDSSIQLSQVLFYHDGDLYKNWSCSNGSTYSNNETVLNISPDCNTPGYAGDLRPVTMTAVWGFSRIREGKEAINELDVASNVLKAVNTNNKNIFTTQNYLEFNGNGATNGALNILMDMSSDTREQTIYIPDSYYERNGIQFKSWNTKSDGTGTSYDKHANLGQITSTKVLYAQY